MGSVSAISVLLYDRKEILNEVFLKIIIAMILTGKSTLIFIYFLQMNAIAGVEQLGKSICKSGYTNCIPFSCTEFVMSGGCCFFATGHFLYCCVT